MSEFVKTNRKNAANFDGNNTDNGKKWQGLEDYRKKDVEYWSDNTRNISSSFATRIRESSRPMSKDEFEKWEDEYMDSRNKVKEAELRMQGDMRTNLTIEERMNLGINPDNTIDARAGDYYRERITVLREAIDKSGGDSNDLKNIEEFYKSVTNHILYRTSGLHDITRLDKLEEFENGREAAHDEVIKRLNQLNSMAEKYGVRRLTPSDFYTSEIKSKENGIAGESRSGFDRDVVEAYYSRALSGEVQDAKRKEQQALKHGGVFYN